MADDNADSTTGQDGATDEWEKRLKALEEREKQLLKLDEMLRQREEEWKKRIEEEEQRLAAEHDRREAELARREKELRERMAAETEPAPRELPPETRELQELQTRLMSHQAGIEQRKEELDQQKKALDVGEDQQTEDTYKKLKEELSGLGDDAIVLISGRAEGHMRMVLALLAIALNEKGEGGIYVSVSRPYRYIHSNLEKNDIELANIYAIDCVSQMAGKVGEKLESVAYVENPSSLEEISMYVDRLLAKISVEQKFILLDSLSSILIYNNPKSVKEFTHFIINKMRLEGIGGFILTQDKKEAQDLIQTIRPLLDKEIRV